MSALIGCTVASPAYYGHARVLAASFLEHHPEGRFVIVDLGAADGSDAIDPTTLPDRAELLPPVELFDEPGELELLGLAYSTQGLAGCLKPRLLRYLLSRGDGPVALLDSDIFVLAGLEDLGERAGAEGLVATPHLITPERSAERPTLIAGTLNSGFVVAARSSLPLLEWWSERTRRDSIFRPSAGMVWEQTWLGLAPAFFDVCVLRDPGVNTMTRELLDHDVEDRDGRPHLAGSPLRAMHFSGPYDPREPEWLLSQADEGPGVERRGGGDGLPWLSLADRPGALAISTEYARRLIEAGAEDRRGAAPPFATLALSGGPIPVHQAFRTAFREAVIAAEAAGAELPPNPFAGDCEPDAFIDWLAEPVATGGGRDSSLNRFLVGLKALYAETAFREVPGPDTAAYLSWARHKLGPSPLGIPARLLPQDRAHPSRRRLGPRRPHRPGK